MAFKSFEDALTFCFTLGFIKKNVHQSLIQYFVEAPLETVTTLGVLEKVFSDFSHVRFLHRCLIGLGLANPKVELPPEPQVLCTLKHGFFKGFILSSILINFPVRAAEMHPYSIMLPPPCLTVEMVLAINEQSLVVNRHSASCSAQRVNVLFFYMSFCKPRADCHTVIHIVCLELIYRQVCVFLN